ncbi:hypothetical protein [Nostoc sp. WHI]|uniref:hypothetical protein n=1 Tax=Nostoc sp. WHI TaxID=2650611 RepID=UPI0018C761FD|nr:hypothetical protein [Nostoc sp. WHI]MBG1269063.1 hypothetical protein [Nostoc sp. WHI]
MCAGLNYSLAFNLNFKSWGIGSWAIAYIQAMQCFNSYLYTDNREAVSEANSDRTLAQNTKPHS